MDGVIVGCNRAQEWLLPWWWLHYRLHNAHPVTFVDFGMSEAGKKWCRERGSYVALDTPADFVAKKEEVDFATGLLWDVYGEGNDIWTSRLEWYKKPMALQKTPYERTLWIDLDCQLRIDVAPLFPLCENPAGIAIAPNWDSVDSNYDRDFGMVFPDEMVYNTGVIVYKKSSPLIDAFVRRAVTCNKAFITDQHLFSRILYESRLPFTELPRRYNTWLWKTPSSETAIYHWICLAGKKAIAANLQTLSPLFLNRSLVLDAQGAYGI